MITHMPNVRELSRVEVSRPRCTLTLIAAFAALLTVALPSHAAGSSEDPRPSRQRLQQSVTALSGAEFEGRLTGTAVVLELARLLAASAEPEPNSEPAKSKASTAPKRLSITTVRGSAGQRSST